MIQTHFYKQKRECHNQIKHAPDGPT